MFCEFRIAVFLSLKERICSPKEFAPLRILNLLLKEFARLRIFCRFVFGKNDFPYHFKKIIVRYKKIGYNINVMRQTACLVVNPIKIDSFAYLFNCTTVGRTSD